MTEKKILEDWKEHVRAIVDATHVDEQEPEEQQRERIAALEADPEEWFKYYFPSYAFAPPAPFHLAATQRIINNPEHYEVRMWSRELAKSTRTMMEVLYLTLVGHPCKDAPGLRVDAHGLYNVERRQRKRYVLLVSNSQDNANRLLMPYKANLEHNRRIIQDYGIQETSGKWQAGEFTTEAGVAFRAMGVGQSPRGTRNEEVRPDVLLFDDVDTDTDCLNPRIVAQKWRWIEEAAIGTRSVSRPTTIVFCGNRIAVDCCIDRAIAFADHHEEVSIRNAAGTSSWPAKNAEADIDRVLKQKSYASVQKEYYNNPLTEGAVFGQVAYKPPLPLQEYKQLVCYTDPSYKDNADFKATVLVGKTGEEFHVLRCYVRQATTSAMLGWYQGIARFVGTARCTYYMEDVFMQDVIRKELTALCARSGMSLSIRPDKRKKKDKYMRIEALLEPLHRNGMLFFNEEQRHDLDMMRLADQFKAFAPGSSAHDDGPDAVEGAIYIIDNGPSPGLADDIHLHRPPGKRENRI